MFHRDPLQRPPGIDLERLTALAAGLAATGVSADILAPVEHPAAMRAGSGGTVAVRPLTSARDGQYDILKTCYHPGIDLISDFQGPVVCRLVRVVDDFRPERDEPQRARLLAWQQKIHARAGAVAFNNRQNLERWQRLYGWNRPAVLTPTGCPAEIPPRGSNPYGGGPPAVLFLGSLAAPRMVRMLNLLAEGLRGVALVHLVGLNKSALYGAPVRLSSLVVDHGPQSGPRMWDFVTHAKLGIALAASPDEFDNDSSKVCFYLRGGLPVLCEEPILQRRLVADLEMGLSFLLGDTSGMIQGARSLLAQRLGERREVAMRRMAREHAWGRRVDTYRRLFAQLLEGRRQA